MRSFLRGLIPMLGDEVGEGVHNEAAPLPEFLGPDSQLPDPVAPLGFGYITLFYLLLTFG